MTVTGGARSLDARARVTLVLGCAASAPGPCAGSVVLKTARAVAAQRRRKRVLALGRASFSIAPGKTAKVRVKVGKAGLRALRRAGRLSVRAAITSSNAAKTTKTFTLRPRRR
jgi:hypothetical protein